MKTGEQTRTSPRMTARKAPGSMAEGGRAHLRLAARDGELLTDMPAAMTPEPLTDFEQLMLVWRQISDPTATPADAKRLAIVFRSLSEEELTEAIDLLQAMWQGLGGAITRAESRLSDQQLDQLEVVTARVRAALKTRSSKASS